MKNYFLIILVMFSKISAGTNFYVSTSGSDNNNGIAVTSPFQTLQHAVDVLIPGDTVFAMNGTYTNSWPNSSILYFPNSGTSSRWMVIKNFPGHQPQIKLNGNNWAGISTNGQDYIVVDGFRIIGNNDSISLAYAQSQQTNTNNPATSGNGIGIDREYGNEVNKSHHIIVRNCVVSKCGGGGIYSYGADYIRIENNIISQCAFYSPYGNSGISMYQNWNSDSSKAIKNFVTGNTCYRNEEYIPFFAVGSITDGNGIIIDDSRNTQNGSTLGPYKGWTYVANNVVFDNGGRGIHCYSSDKVIVVNNTCYQNCQSLAVSDGELTAYDTDSILFINNISFPSAGIPPIQSSINTSTHVRVYNNLWAANSSLAIPIGNNSIIASPAFVNPTSNSAIADFHLQISSNAINNGSHFYAPSTDKDGNNRPPTDSVDIGAYEYRGILPLTILSLSGHNANENNILEWKTASEMNCSHFLIERMIGEYQFVEIGKVENDQSPSIQHSYFFKDNKSPYGVSYYRLRQMDFDGKSIFSKIIAIRRTRNEGHFAISPNPANKTIRIISKESVGLVMIQSMDGREVIRKSNSLEINISHLTKGIYSVKLFNENGENIKTMKLIKE